MRETLTERLERLKPFTSSTRYALTEDDVRHDYAAGRDRYRPFDKQGEVEPFDVQADWDENHS